MPRIVLPSVLVCLRFTRKEARFGYGPQTFKYNHNNEAPSLSTSLTHRLLCYSIVRFCSVALATVSDKSASACRTQTEALAAPSIRAGSLTSNLPARTNSRCPVLSVISTTSVRCVVCNTQAGADRLTIPHSSLPLCASHFAHARITKQLALRRVDLKGESLESKDEFCLLVFLLVILLVILLLLLVCVLCLRGLLVLGTLALQLRPDLHRRSL
mmetsp:Transcript_37007/g.62320  ORF Transcript_37007/g.62320 Transcript_37007/m.62320 type:complete len:214 (+) Transcript_37007:340-981(+)